LILFDIVAINIKLYLPKRLNHHQNASKNHLSINLATQKSLNFKVALGNGAKSVSAVLGIALTLQPNTLQVKEKEIVVVSLRQIIIIIQPLILLLKPI
jgi:hypothetical protein